jgi:uncharacterized protein DUF4230
MFKQRLANVALVLGLVFALGLIVGVVLPGWLRPRPATKVYNSATVIKQVQTLSQLVTVKYVMERVEELEAAPNSTLGQWLISITGDSRVLLLAHGIVKAGVDFSRLSPGDLRVTGKTIYIQLPPAEITDAYLDEKLTRVIERQNGRFLPFDKDLEQNARQNALDNIRRAARNSGIFKDADERARLQLSNLCKQLGFDEVQFEKR